MSEANAWRSLERETGIEPATNSLEGCDSTTELLPLLKPAISYQPSAFRENPGPAVDFHSLKTLTTQFRGADDQD